MNIPATLLLIFGIAASTLFVAVFIAALVITIRNRKIIKRHLSPKH